MTMKIDALKLRYDHFRTTALSFIGLAISLFIVYLQTTSLTTDTPDAVKSLIHITTGGLGFCFCSNILYCYN